MQMLVAIDGQLVKNESWVCTRQMGGWTCDDVFSSLPHWVPLSPVLYHKAVFLNNAERHSLGFFFVDGG